VSRGARWLRALGVIHGASLMLGETLRSWGRGRPLAFVLDDLRSNGSGELLTALIGLAVVAALACMVATIALRSPALA
jgi:hypothetical protein